MLATSIMELIRRRRDEFRQRSDEAEDASALERTRSISEEYDSLLTKIEALEDEHSRGRTGPIIQDDPSEQWILGDQGQPGG